MSAEPTFGARFLEEWKRLGGPLSNWTWAEIQELRASDQEGVAAALRAHQPHISYAALQRVRTAESPELLARDALTRLQIAASSSAGVWLMLSLLT